MASLVSLGLVMTACSSPDDDVSGYMAEGFLPFLGRFAGFSAVHDWRTLGNPTDSVRTYFESQRAAYRVISAQRDRADLAVWQTAAAGAEPFNANVEGTGHGCVTLIRTASGGVRSRVRGCPRHLGPPADSTSVSWGRDTNAVASAGVLIDSVEFDVRWLLTKDARGYPRRIPPTRTEVLATIRAVRRDSGQTLRATPSPTQHPGRVAATVSVSATAPDPVDTRRTVTARRCARVDVRLDGTDPSGLLTVLHRTDCR